MQVSRVVTPKRHKLWEAEELLREMNAQLEDKQLQLRSIEDAVAKLTASLNKTQCELVDLQAHADLSARRLIHAEQLISTLRDESVRWKEVQGQKDRAEELMVGDVLLSAACISYLGPFTAPFRENLVARWLAECNRLGVAVSPVFSLQRTLSSDIEIRSWILQVHFCVCLLCCSIL